MREFGHKLFIKKILYTDYGVPCVDSNFRLIAIPEKIERDKLDEIIDSLGLINLEGYINYPLSCLKGGYGFVPGVGIIRGRNKLYTQRDLNLITCETSEGDNIYKKSCLYCTPERYGDLLYDGNDSMIFSNHCGMEKVYYRMLFYIKQGKGRIDIGKIGSVKLPQAVLSTPTFLLNVISDINDLKDFFL